MNIFNKISMLISKLITSKDVSPLLGDTINTNDLNLSDLGIVGLVIEWLGGIIYNFIFTIVGFLLSILDILQLAIYRIMGIGVNASTYTVIDPNNPILKFLTNDAVSRAFRIFFVIALVLIVVYTVFAIVISEYRAATSGADNKKGRIAARSLRSILLLVLFPALLLGGIILTNSLFAGFNSVFSDRIAYNSTLGTNLFVSSSTSASRYRIYANNNSRMPILFDFEDPYQNGSLHGYTTEELLTTYNSFQATGKQLYSNFALNKFDKFNDTLVYKNNKFYNASTYNGFEKFIVTPEQYQVMADFLDYAMINRVEFYIKNIKDEDIEWKYIDEAIFDKSSTSLKITYKDANDLVDGSDVYTVEYTPSSYEMSTPISDAFDTISNILAIGDYKDNLFNVMNREEGSINVVFWEHDNVYLKLSNNYKNNPNYVDKLLLYEFNRFDYNNTLDCTIDELENGIFLPLMKLDKRSWRTDLQAYITTEELYVVQINGTYYKVYLPDAENAMKDEFNDFCYEIIDPTPIQGLAICSNHPAHVDGDPYVDYHEDLNPCYDANCQLVHYHITTICDDEHPNHVDGDPVYDYHMDGSICYNASCTETHYHKVDSYASEINRCNDANHYETCTDRVNCGFEIHFNSSYEVDNVNGTLHHNFNPYPECDGTNCNKHNHYHFDGSRYKICYEACYEEHYHADGVICTNESTCGNKHYHVGDECESPYCNLARFGQCASTHYHTNGELCNTPETCGNDYHRHTIGVCNRLHYHADNSLCSSYDECMESYHRHANDWQCTDSNCTKNHYHADNSHCVDSTCLEVHLHDSCIGCNQEHYYFVEPYYEECSAGISACSKYHYHLSEDSKSYIDCNDELCAKTHYHYIYPNDDNCIYFKQLTKPGYFKYFELDTFADIKQEKLNGAYTNYTTIDGLEVGTTSYHDDIVTKVIKQVNWPQKLMNDMQVIYDKLNLNLLLTTGDWLTQLSNIIGSSMTNGWENGPEIENNSASFDTSLIHPIGLIIAELFLNEVAEDRTSYFGEYEFKSSLDEQDIRALLLAICGEEKYRQLSLQVDYFVELFNIYMEPVIEQVAYYENFDLVNGELCSEQLYTYRAYLSSILMSSTCIEYLFDSALAYIGASNFSYGVLSNPDLVNSLYEYYYSIDITPAEKAEKYPNPPVVDIYMNVTISPTDYAAVNKEATEAGTLSSIDELFSKLLQGEDISANLSDFGSIENLLEHKDFASIIKTGQFTYAQFVELFGNVSLLFPNKERCTNLSNCSSIHYHIKDGTTDVYEECSLNTCIKEHYHLDSEIRDFIDDYFNFNDIDNNSYINEIIDTKLLPALKIIITPADSTEIVNVVDSTYKTFNNLDSYYKNYLYNANKTGIYDKIVSEMEINGNKRSNPDFEYIISLESYVTGNTNRWNFVQASDYEKGYELVGQLNKLTSIADDYIDNVPVIGNSGLIGQGFTMNSLDVLYELVESQDKSPDDPTVDDGNDIIENFSIKPSAVYMILFNYASENIDTTQLEFSDWLDFLNYSLSDYIEILMKQANSTSTDAVYGYENSTKVLYNIAQILERYLAQFSITFDLNEDALKEFMTEEKFEENHPILNILGSTNLSKYFSELISDCQDLAFVINDYLDTLEKIDVLNKYYVTHAVSAYVSSHINTEFDVVVNSKHYTVGSAMSPGKLAEYILGAEKINNMGYQCSFVDDDYKGLVAFEEKEVGGVKYYELSDYLSYLNEFAIGFGETSTSIFNLTNFLKLSTNAVDELVICENDDLMRHVLNLLTQNNYLPDDILLARFNLELVKDINGNVTSIKDLDTNSITLISGDISTVIQGLCGSKYTLASGEALKKYYLNVIDYLFITETRKDINFEKMSLKDLRTYTIDFLINYEQLDSESTEQNQKRYLALFYLSCSDWTRESGFAGDYNSLDYVAGDENTISGLEAHNASMGMVLKLAGIDNRPDVELVGLEYSLDLNFAGIDEANGDLFIICTYDDENHYYVPFLMCNKDNIRFNALDSSDMNKKIHGLKLINDGTTTNPNYYNWVTKYGYKDAVTSYYKLPSQNAGEAPLSFDNNTCFYPIIARGGFDEYGRPTAIRQVGDNIEFYRESVVIQNASELGLTTYYASIENLYHPRGFLANTVNGITKLITGKTLSQNLAEKIPRFAINFTANLPYGVDSVEIEDIDSGRVRMNYTFSGASLKLNTVYEQFDINLLLLLLSIIVVFSFIFKALWGVIGRLLEIVTLYILGPVAISSIALKYDEKNKDGNFVEKDGAMSGIYDQWKTQLIQKVLLAFGYIFGLNIFYLLLPMVNGFELFQDTTPFADLPWGGKLPISLINTMASVFMVIALASAIIYAPKILSKVMQFTEAFSYGAQMQTQVKNTIEQVKDNISGQRVMDFVADQKQNLKNMIPGVVLIEKGFQKIGQARDKSKAKKVRDAAIAAKIPSGKIDAAMKAYEASMKQQRINKAKYKEKKEKERQKRNEARANWD